MRILGIATSVFLIGILLAGCTGRVSSSRGFLDGVIEKHDFDDRIVVQVGQPIEIDVDSFNGDVIIRADAELTEATVRVQRVATHGVKRSGEAKDSLVDIDYSVEIVAGNLGQVLQIRTWTTHAEPYFQRANVFIDVPAVDGVFVRTNRGDVVVRNAEGEIDISTNEGDVRLATNLAMRRPVTITNRDGDIEYRVRGESTGIFDCQAFDGKVDHRVLYGEFRVAASRRKGRLQAVLNQGDNPVLLRTTTGNVAIAVVADATDVGMFIQGP